MKTTEYIKSMVSDMRIVGQPNDFEKKAERMAQLLERAEQLILDASAKHDQIITIEMDTWFDDLKKFQEGK